MPHSERVLDDRRNIAIALTETEKGEAKAQVCDMACLQQLSLGRINAPGAQGSYPIDFAALWGKHD